MWFDSITDGWVVGKYVYNIDNWDDPEALVNSGTFQLGEYGLLMEMVEGAVKWNLEVSRDTVMRNIRKVFEWLHIKAYVCHDRIEITG